MQEIAVRNATNFEEFYERNWKFVYRLCFTYMGNQADAEDCTEDVFVKVFNKKIEFEDETHERKWLSVTAGNLCKDRLRSAARKEVCSIDDENTPEIAAPEAEDHSDVLQAVLELPAKYKDVIWLYYYEDHPTEEIAKILDRPSSTVRNQLRDARNLLKEKLEEMIRR
ncbi:MAG: sigma-70 family RNA polymerase sigma factor [Lachnospiraceae bacterium]|nr:sigma-70 family RNA polymerase sigma factor [Lachnospiraceae bacterium]